MSNDKTRLKKETIVPEEIEAIIDSDISLYQLLTSRVDCNFSDVIYGLVHQEYDEGTSKQLWVNILHHHDNMADLLGRDPGILVATLDYLYNIKESLHHPVIVERESLPNLIEDEVSGE